MIRTIAVFTGTRADYGLLRRLALAIDASADAELALIVSGSHLSAAHGMTSGEIAEDGLPFAATVPIWSGDDTPMGAARDVGAAIPRYAETLDRLAPDILVVLGDRLESFAIATAATIAGVPIAHIHGGEITEGAMDDALRHAITKMAFLHFTSTADHRRRVIQLGEHPDRVHFLGAPIVDALADLQLLSDSEVMERFGVRLDRPTALVTFHPAAMDVLPPAEILEELLAGLLAVDELGIIVTGSNSDIGSTAIRDRIAAWVRENQHRVDHIESFGQLGYLSAMSHASVVAGNSSSVVLEAPVLGTPSVLVGDRQKGRPLAGSVRVPEVRRDAIATALREACSCGPSTSAVELFGVPGFAERARDVLLTAGLSRPPRKFFYDL
ncbi:MAG: UDP-N-acetylglucosamine 2-epimerase (hydrolyzing) [Demequinaceae bacterium]|nr:UDP-N-acetylglucosamine 2-epimerase (hydrolyzing) [Demequinaceae bacterium]